MLSNPTFNLMCAHCQKISKAVPTAEVFGLGIIKVIQSLGYKYRNVEQEDGGYTIIAYCSSYCKFRHGRTAGIHRLLNKLGL